MPDSQPQPQPPDRATADTSALLLRGARLADGRTVDVRLCGGLIEAVGTAGSLAAHSSRLDLTGHLLLPAPAEPHAHSDTALTAAGPRSPSCSSEEVRRRTTEAALLQLGHGATALRSHVSIGEAQGLGRLEAVLQARRSLRGLGDLTAVAMPGSLTGLAGADGAAMLRDAVRMGAGAVGGRPDRAPDPAAYAEKVLEVAAELGCRVDLHTDGDDPALLARLAAMAAGLGPRVTLGPCAGLSRLPAGVAGRVADQLAEAGITVVCLPQGACAAMGYGAGADGPVPGGGTARAGERPDGRHGCAPVRLLRAAGVRVAAGSGALREWWNPVGRGDPLEAAYLLASQAGMRAADAYDTVSGAARAAMGLPEVRVEAGFPAELLAVRGDGIESALSLAYSRIVIHRGRVVARTSAVREYCDSEVVGALELPRQGRQDPGPLPTA